MDKDQTITLGRVIRALRLVKGVSQEAMHKDVGMSSAYISLLETDKREPSMKKLKKLADFFEISTNGLLFVGSGIPDELDDQDKKKYSEMQKKMLTETLSKKVNGETPWQLKILDYVATQ